MSAKAIVWDGEFGNPMLPQISIGYSPILPNALFDWAADGLPLGPITNWSSMVDGAALSSDGGSPQVVNSGSGRAIRLNGTSDRMRTQYVVNTPRTFVVVYRFTAVEPSSAVLYGYLSNTGGAIMSDSSSVLINGAGGGQFLTPNPYIKPDTSWHVTVLSVNGANSAFRHDDREITGSLTVKPTDGITLGFGGAPDFRAPIEFKRVAVIEGGTTAAYRESLVAQLAQRYGITF